MTLKIGMVGLDTSHVTAFTELLHNEDHPHHVRGGKVVAAFPGGSPDWHLSSSRVGGFTQQLAEQYGVTILDSIEAVAEASDVIMLESADGRVHLEQFRKLAPYGKPVFVDKPLATSLADAKEMVKLAEEHGVPLMSSSALRYAEVMVQGLTGASTTYSADCYGPMSFEPPQPGYFWYGIHTAEMLYTILGKGCRTVTVHSSDGHDVIVGKWDDGRFGVIHGSRTGSSDFGALVDVGEDRVHLEVKRGQVPFYASLLQRVMEFFRTRKSPISIEETLEIIAFLEAANLSLETGKPVNL